MYERPPFTGIWKQLSIGIATAIIIMVLSVFIEIFLQKQEKDRIRLIKFNGILIKKKNLTRGNYSITLRSANKKKEFDLRGYAFFFDKIEIGDSLSKHVGSMKFDVFRKYDTSFLFQTTIGHE